MDTGTRQKAAENHVGMHRNAKNVVVRVVLAGLSIYWMSLGCGDETTPKTNLLDDIAGNHGADVSAGQPDIGSSEGSDVESDAGVGDGAIDGGFGDAEADGEAVDADNEDAGQNAGGDDSTQDVTGDVAQQDAGRDSGLLDSAVDAGTDVHEADASDVDTGVEPSEDAGGTSDTGTDVGGQDTGTDSGRDACVTDCAGKCGGVSDGCGGTCDSCVGSYQCKGTACVHCGEYGEECCNSDLCNGANECNRGTCVVGNCVGKPNFTLCKLITSPDRWYDICAHGVCVSPGCGDATCNALGPHFSLPDTNQRKCYNNNPSTVITCPVAAGGTPCAPDGSPDFCGQDAQYGWDTSHTGAERFTVTELAADQPVAEDNITGLVWQGCPAGKSGKDCSQGTASKVAWTNALSYCDGLDWGGATDWRLPDRYEINSIEDLSVRTPSLDVTVFPLPATGTSWCSSTLASDTTVAWGGDFTYGQIRIDFKTTPWYVRCVRGRPTPRAERFVRSLPVTNEPVVTDSVTGLIWQGCPAGQSGSMCGSGSAASYTWQQALKYCESLTWSGETNWRLPSIKELVSVVDDRFVSPSVDVTLFPGTPLSFFWASSSWAVGNQAAWVVSFTYGDSDGSNKPNANNVRCVRDEL